MEKIELAEDVYLIRGFLTEDEGDRFVEQSERMGFAKATITTTHGQKMIKKIVKWS